MEFYLVGGCVRDELLRLKVVDRDWVVVGADEQQMLKLNFQKVGKDFPVFLHPESHEEYALARTERKVGHGYYGFECYSAPTVTLEQDLQRRDLTINAIAKSIDGKIIDPFHGQRDIEKKILRHVSAAFVEDPVRVLRVARFAARYFHLGFSIADETIELMNNMVANGEIDELVPERVWKEMVRALGENNPEIFFKTLRITGALERIFPALNKLWGIPQDAKWHPEIDTGEHVMLALQRAAKFTDNTCVHFAVLCHDLGKGVTPQEILPSHRGHEHKGVPLVQAWCNAYKVPNNYKNLALKVTKWHLHAHRAFELNPKTILKLLKSLNAFRDSRMFFDFLLACQADAQGRKNMENKPYLQADFLKQVYEIAKSIDIKNLIEQGLTGAKLGSALHKAKINAIKQYIIKFK